MRELLGKRMFRQVLTVCLLVCMFSAKGYIEVSDTAFSLQTAQAIVTHGQLDIPYVEGATLRGPDGRSYSKYGLGLPLYYVPWVAASDALSSFAAGTRIDGVFCFPLRTFRLPCLLWSCLPSSLSCSE